MTTREPLEVKAGRLLAEGRLTVLSIDRDRITAAVRADHGTYALGHHPAVRGGWWCGCPALRAHRHRKDRIMTPKYQQDYVDVISHLSGRDFATFDEAADWVLSEEGTQVLESWAVEGTGYIEVPASACRPMDQIFGDPTGVDREGLPARQAAEIASALDAIAAAQ